MTENIPIASNIYFRIFSRLESKYISILFVTLLFVLISQKYMFILITYYPYTVYRTASNKCSSSIRNSFNFNVNNIKILKQVQITVSEILLIFSLIFNLFFKITRKPVFGVSHYNLLNLRSSYYSQSLQSIKIVQCHTRKGYPEVSITGISRVGKIEILLVRRSFVEFRINRRS